MDVLHEYASVPRMDEIAGGKLGFPATGAVAKALEVQDAVIAGALDGGRGVCAQGPRQLSPSAPSLGCATRSA